MFCGDRQTQKFLLSRVLPPSVQCDGALLVFVMFIICLLTSDIYRETFQMPRICSGPHHDTPPGPLSSMSIVLFNNGIAEFLAASHLAVFCVLNADAERAIRATSCGASCGRLPRSPVRPSGTGNSEE